MNDNDDDDDLPLNFPKTGESIKYRAEQEHVLFIPSVYFVLKFSLIRYCPSKLL
jgi:hypothetical protein